jgi:cytidylate kinase
MSSKLFIAVSGKSGCGNTSSSKIVAEKLGLRFINYTFHDYARDLGIPFPKLLALAEKDSLYDLNLDKRQLELAREGSCVLGSRLAIWLLKEATVKVYLDASLKVRAERVARREKKNLETTIKETARRDAHDRNRYLKLYGIDNDDYRFADLVVDTEKGDQYYVAGVILDFVKARGLA